MKQKFMCVLLALVLCLSLVPAGALASGESEEAPEEGVLSAEEEPERDGESSGTVGSLTWTLSDDGVLTISGTGNLRAGPDVRDVKNLVIGEGVTGVAEDAFAGYDSLTTVTIPVSMTIIGEGAFRSCSRLETVNYSGTEEQWEAISIASGNDALCPAYYGYISGTNGDNITWRLMNDGTLIISGTGDMSGVSESDYGWYGYRSRILHIVVEEGVTSVGQKAFSEFGSVESVRLPEGVTVIGYMAFYSCRSLKSVSIPLSTAKIETAAFFKCYALETVDYPGTDEQWRAIDLTVGNSLLSFVRDGSVSGVLDIGPAAGTFPWTVESDGTLTVSGNGMLTVDDYEWEALAGVIRRVVFESGITVIEDNVFTDYPLLESVVLPTSITRIGTGFNYCEGLKDIYYAGTEDQWAKVDYKRTGGYPISKAAVHYESTGAPADIAWTLSEDGVLTITGEGALPVPSPWTEVSAQVKSLVVGEGITGIEANAFSGYAALESVSLPAGLGAIPAQAFKNCGALERVSIPASVKSVGQSAFSGCASLQTVDYAGTEDQWAAIDIQSDNAELIYARAGVISGTVCEGVAWTLTADGTLTVSGRGTADYHFETHYPGGYDPKSWDGNNKLVRRIVVEEGITALGENLFSSCLNAESASLPESLTAIGRNAFGYCISLKSINIPVTVTEIGLAAFDCCRSLETVEYAGTDEQWQAISIAESNHFLFLAHDGETSYSVGTIGWRLTRDGDLTISQKGMYSYYDKWWSDAEIADRFRTVTVEEGVVSLYRGAFFEFENVTRIELPSSLRAVDEGAFAECRSLTDIVFHGTEAEWAEVIRSRTNDDLSGVTVHCTDTVEDDIPSVVRAAQLLRDEFPDEAAAAWLLRLAVGDKLAIAENLVGSYVIALYRAIGEPISASYSESCLVLGAEDGLLSYDGFVVETIRYRDGSEKVFDAYAE